MHNDAALPLIIKASLNLKGVSDMTNSEYGKYIEKAIEILPHGAFLTTHDGSKTNTMTIGWGSFAFDWGMPVFEALVRESRFSKSALDEKNSFTVTFPYGSDMKDALSYCGSKSGRDCDKIADCGLVLGKSKSVDVPYVSCHGIVLECKIVMRLPMNQNLVSDEVLEKWYPNGDLHTLYFGKITECYEI